MEVTCSNCGRKLNLDDQSVDLKPADSTVRCPACKTWNKADPDAVQLASKKRRHPPSGPVHAFDT
jgi:DNA-directed RNA polymerase subunit RPC12/RpoP